ncbi:MAG TPA: DUF362 domain-containing protein [Candidatus Bathyarchaeia archaeon]|nr:DUF362 domain-containing protein [Candidatus Bathyarchaeia archaeon]
MSKTVCLAKGTDHYQNITNCLNLIRGDIEKALIGREKVVIKVNFVSPENELAATPIESVTALLDFLRPIYKKRIQIMETGKNAALGFKNFNYPKLTEKYNVKLTALDNGNLVPVFVYDVNLKKRIKVEIYQEALSADFLISITRAKTHNYGIVTLGLKNIAAGFLKDTSLIHQGYQAFNKNLFLLIKKIQPDLSIIDATVGMEGNGPISGQPIKVGWALASPDALRADIIAARLMGFNPKQIGYLHFCLEAKGFINCLPKVNILGNTPEECRTKFKPPDDIARQLKWDHSTKGKEKAKIVFTEKYYSPFKKSRLGQRLNVEPLAQNLKRLLGF